MMFPSKYSLGFSLIELMVVMAIMAVLMSLSGGLFQQSINQQERHVELEKTQQLFKQLAYKAYYQGSIQKVRIEENKVYVFSKINQSDDLLAEEIDLANGLFNRDINDTASVQSSLLSDMFYQDQGDTQTAESDYVVERVIEFNQLTFVAQHYDISTNGIIQPSHIGVFTKNGIRKFTLASVFSVHE